MYLCTETFGAKTAALFPSPAKAIMEEGKREHGEGPSCELSWVANKLVDSRDVKCWKSQGSPVLVLQMPMKEASRSAIDTAFQQVVILKLG